jgi:hypothetical protein
MRTRDRCDEHPGGARETRAPRWPGLRPAIAVAVLAGIALLAAACSAGSSSGPASTAASPSSGIYQQYLAYSRCMQTHGAPFWPDPNASVTNRGFPYTITPRILAAEHGRSWNAALTACAKLASPQLQLPWTAAQLVPIDARMLKLTRCMRAHGFRDWPDPIVNPYDAGFLPPRGVNIQDPSPQLQAAQQACHSPAAP